MADKPDSLEEEANNRLRACRVWKSFITVDVRECYFFAAPDRQGEVSSMSRPSLNPTMRAPELNTDQAFLMVQDFVTEIMNGFAPEATPWCERGPGMDLPAGVWDKIKDDVEAGDKQIFTAMKASNLYPELTKAWYPDLAIGTVGLWISRPHPRAPITVLAVPFRELEINLGPDGKVDDRFAVRYTRNSYVHSMVGDEVWAKVDPELKATIEAKPTTETQVIWGFWRLWDDQSDEVWRHVIMINNSVVHDAELRGEGCVALNVHRFNPTADWPHGYGPLRQALPSFRQIDELIRMRIKHAALSIDPPITYPDDSFAAVEQGVEEGMAYPIRPGSEGAVKAIYTPPPAEAANYQYEEIIKTLRKLFFIDMPEQTGDTPPTLGQWLDEMARAQRRIGTPGLPFWREGPADIFTRFKYLLEASGSIKPIRVDGRAVATMPRNPAQAAAEQQEVGMAMKAIGFLSQAFPEEFKMYVDGKKTMLDILAKMRVTLIKMRSPDDVAKATNAMAQLAGARHAGVSNDQMQPPGPAA